MEKIFLWFYCLPIPDALILFTAATVLFLWLRIKIGNQIWWKFGIFLLLFCWIAVILYGTVGQRSGGTANHEPILIPFYTYYAVLTGGSRELLRESLMNALLFYPAGLLTFEALPGKWSRWGKTLLIILSFAILSTGIEIQQYRLAIGLVEVDDIIHNTLGAILGTLGHSLPVVFAQKDTVS